MYIGLGPYSITHVLARFRFSVIAFQLFAAMASLENIQLPVMART